MATQWFYKLMGDEIGPLSGADLKENAALGNVRQDSLVRKGADGEWVSAWRVNGLFDNPRTPRIPNIVAEPPPIAQVSSIERTVAPPVPAETPEPAGAMPTVEGTQRAPPGEPPKTKIRIPRKWLVVAAVLVALIPAYSWLHNDGLRGKLRSCETYGVVVADAYYDGLFDSEAVVFDLQDGGSSTARRVDPVHLLMEFSGKIDLYSAHRVILARNGRQVFYVESTELRRLAESYAGGGRIWAFNHLPESVRTMSGARAYEQWTGGWLGVLGKQLDDFNSFIRDWTGY